MKFNKIYLQKDAIRNAIDNDEDFETWYEDGDLFFTFHSKDHWKSEKTPVQVFGRMGGQNALIKPDNRALNYFIQHERWEYIMHPYVIGHHYYIEGMVWNLYGSFFEPPFDIFEETMTSFYHKAVHVKMKEFKNKGLCYEIHCPDVRQLRIAVLSVVAIGIKEEWKGLSEGEEVQGATWYQRLRNRVFDPKGFTYEQIQHLIETDSALVRPIKPQGRPIDIKKQKKKK